MRLDPPLYPQAPAAAIEAVRLGVPLRPSRWSAWDALWAVMGWFVLANGAVLALAASGIDVYGPGFLLTVLAPWVALAGWPLWITRRRGNGAAIDLGLTFNRKDVKIGLLGGLAAFVLGMIAAAVSVMLFGDFSAAAADEAEKLADSGSVFTLIALAVLVVVGAPVAEELTFRGLLWSGLAKRRAAAWVCVLVTAAAFAAIHFEPKRVLVLFTIGVVLGLVRLYSGSVGASIIAHAVNNTPPAIGLLALLVT